MFSHIARNIAPSCFCETFSAPRVVKRFAPCRSVSPASFCCKQRTHHFGDHRGVRHVSCGAEERLRRDLALCHRLCERFNFHEGVCNHLSVALPGNELFLLGRYGCHWSHVSSSELLLMDHAGNVVSGEGQPEMSGFYSHRALHTQLGEDAAVVLHVHMPFATTLTLIRAEHGGTLLPVHQNMARFYKYVAYEDSYGGFFTGETDASDRIAACAISFRDRHGKVPRALMCANHGVFVFGRTVPQAWSDLYYLERLCEVQVRALNCVGGDATKLKLLGDGQLEETQRQYELDRASEASAHWTAMIDIMQDHVELTSKQSQ